MTNIRDRTVCRRNRSHRDSGRRDIGRACKSRRVGDNGESNVCRTDGGLAHAGGNTVDPGGAQIDDQNARHGLPAADHGGRDHGHAAVNRPEPGRTGPGQTGSLQEFSWGASGDRLICPETQSSERRLNTP